jgi:hypothetical protein
VGRGRWEWEDKAGVKEGNKKRRIWSKWSKDREDWKTNRYRNSLRGMTEVMAKKRVIRICLEFFLLMYTPNHTHNAVIAQKNFTFF